MTRFSGSSTSTSTSTTPHPLLIPAPSVDTIPCVKLVYVDPAAAPVMFDLARKKIVRFGRSREDNQVVLRCRKNPDNPSSPEDRDFSLKISRSHLEVILQDGRPAVVDRGSKKGTFLGDRQLAANEPHVLADGDVIRVSDVIGLRVAIGPGEIRVTREEPRRSFSLVLGKSEAKTVSEFSQSMETSRLVVLFTDQVGSTRMADALGEKAFHKVRRRRDKLQTDIIQRDGSGRVVKSTGDGLLCVFHAAVDAVARAVEMQQTLQKHNAEHPGLEQIAMRMGIDMGAVTIDRHFNFDVFGMVVNRASRVMDQAGGGEIVVTQAVREAATDIGHAFKPLGLTQLKGISEAEALFRVDYS